MNILVTGWSGFIDSNFLNLIMPQHPENYLINVDKLTYAANPLNLTAIEDLPYYSFEQAELAALSQLVKLFTCYTSNFVIHFAADSHVDRRILGPAESIQSNIISTFNLLEACRKHWEQVTDHFFLQFRTDDVYGSFWTECLFTETTAYDPSSPCSAFKVLGDHLVFTCHCTYGLLVIITNCSNNCGPYQFPEKLALLMIINALEGKPLPFYGKGENVRDWLFVEDHCRAIWATFHRGTPGETLSAETGKPLDDYKKTDRLCPGPLRSRLALRHWYLEN